MLPLSRSRYRSRFFPVIAPPPPPPSGWDLSTAAYSGVSFSVAAQETTPTGVAFKSDGTKMFIIGQIGDDINEYALSTPWNVSTASFTTNTSVAAQTTAPNDLFFKPDGLKAYVCSANSIFEYNLSSAWNIATLTYSGNSFSVSAQESSTRGLFFKPDGTKLYIIGSVAVKAFEYNMSSAWDITTASYSGNNFSTAAQDSSARCLFFKPDGTKMFVLGGSNSAVYEYSVSSAWDVTTASYVTSFSVVSQDSAIQGLFFKSDGTMMFVVGSATDTVFAYTL